MRSGCDDSGAEVEFYPGRDVGGDSGVAGVAARAGDDDPGGGGRQSAAGSGGERGGGRFRAPAASDPPLLLVARASAAVRCVSGSLPAGVTRREILETIGVSMLMGGGPATMYGCEAFEALEQFETELAEEQASREAEQ